MNVSRIERQRTIVSRSYSRFQCFGYHANDIWTAGITKRMRNQNLECFGCWSSRWHHHILNPEKRKKLVSIPFEFLGTREAKQNPVNPKRRNIKPVWCIGRQFNAMWIQILTFFFHSKTKEFYFQEMEPIMTQLKRTVTYSNVSNCNEWYTYDSNRSLTHTHTLAQHKLNVILKSIYGRRRPKMDNESPAKLHWHSIWANVVAEYYCVVWSVTEDRRWKKKKNQKNTNKSKEDKMCETMW